MFFGKYSYCLYVVHQPVSLVLRKGGVTFDRLTGILHNQALAVVAVNTAAFAISIALAYLSWHAFEKHFLKLRRYVPYRYAPAPPTAIPRQTARAA